MEEANARLLQRLASVENKHTAMANEVQVLDSNLRTKSIENEALQAKVQELRKSFTVRSCYSLCQIVTCSAKSRHGQTLFSCSAEQTTGL